MRGRARLAGVLWLARLGPVLTAGLAALLALRRLDNTDTWWHLAAGRWIVEHRRVPWLDQFSYTATHHPWINVQWLFDVVLYGLHRLGGPDALVLASTLAYGAATALMLRHVRRHVGDAATTVLGLWAVAVAQERFQIRPEMVTYGLLQVVLWVYATGLGPGSRRLWALPAVMALWANCHSLFAVGAVVIGCRMAGTLLGQARWLPAGWRTPLDPAVRRRVLATGVAALAATVLNPYGVRGATFPLGLMSRFDRSHLFVRAVGEFQPPFSGYLANLPVGAYQALFVFGCAAVAGALLVAARARRTGRLDLADVAVFVGVAYLSLLARRNMALFALAGMPCIARALAVLAAALPNGGRPLAGAAGRAVAATLVPVLAALGLWVASNGFYRWNGDLHETGLGILDLPSPVHASAFAKAAGLPGPIFNDVTSGGYLTWDRPIAGGVYVDGRLEVYEAAFLDDYLRRLADLARWQDDADRRGIQTVIVTHWYSLTRRLVRHLLTDPRWAPVYYDEAVLVAVRREGNETLITTARATFRAAREQTERRLLDGRRAWRFPIRRARGLARYAAILDLLGKRADAARYRAALASLERRGWR